MLLLKIVTALGEDDWGEGFFEEEVGADGVESAHKSENPEDPVIVSAVPCWRSLLETHHLQLSLCTINPPNNGPSVGPMRGPSRYQPKIPALLPGSNMSERLPPPFATPTDPKKPDSVRIAMSVPMFGLKADGIWSNVKTVKHIRYIGLLPKVSLSGALTDDGQWSTMLQQQKHLSTYDYQWPQSKHDHEASGTSNDRVGRCVQPFSDLIDSRREH